jgi:hypothetical protein
MSGVQILPLATGERKWPKVMVFIQKLSEFQASPSVKSAIMNLTSICQTLM